MNLFVFFTFYYFYLYLTELINLWFDEPFVGCFEVKIETVVRLSVISDRNFEGSYLAINSWMDLKAY